MLKKGVLLILFFVLAGVLFQHNKEAILKKVSNAIDDFNAIKPDNAQRLGVPPYLRDTLYKLLKEGKFSELDNEIESYAKQFDRGEIQELGFGYVIDSFSVIDSSLEPHIKKWIAETNSWSANLAGYQYFERLSWQWRSGSFYRYVPTLNRAKFTEYQSIAERLLANAKQNNARDSLWYAAKIDSIRQGSDGDIEQVINEGLEKFPKSKSIYYSAITAQDTRWGGNAFKRQELIYGLSKIVDEPNYQESEIIYYYRALAAVRDKDYPQALKEITTALERNPNNIGHYSTLSSIYSNLNQYEDALRATNTALKYYPLSRVSLTDRAYLHIQLNKLELAKKDIELLLKYSPNHREGNLQALSLYASLKDTEKFKSQLKKATFFTEFDPHHWVRLAYYAHYDLKDYGIAESMYKKALDIEALDVGANYRLALLYGVALESCDVVEPLYNYFQGCQQGVGRTKRWCQTRDKKWAYTAVNFLKDHQKCPTVNDYNFDHF